MDMLLKNLKVVAHLEQSTLACEGEIEKMYDNFTEFLFEECMYSILEREIGS